VRAQKDLPEQPPIVRDQITNLVRRRDRQERPGSQTASWRTLRKPSTPNTIDNSV